MTLELGFIGLGRMGSAMLSRLLDGGCRATAYNRTAAAAAPFAARAATVVQTPAQVARPGGLVISMLTDEAAVRAVCTGPDGILPHLAGGTHLSMSTLSPDFAHEMARLHRDAGVAYISVPVQGRPPMAAAGQLVGWRSGPEPDAAAALALSSLCRQQIVLGADVRHAYAAKLALNFMMFASVEALAEALAYVNALGADPARFIEGLTQGMFPGPLFAGAGAALLSADDAAKGSDINLCIKDLGLMLGGMAADSDLPIARRLEGVFRSAAAAGLGDRDATAVRRVVGPSVDGVPHTT